MPLNAVHDTTALVGYWFSLNTPKALANFSPRVRACENLGNRSSRKVVNPERIRRERNPFRVSIPYVCVPKVEATLGLELAHAFGVLKLNQYRSLAALDCEISETDDDHDDHDDHESPSTKLIRIYFSSNCRARRVRTTISRGFLDDGRCVCLQAAKL